MKKLFSYTVLLLLCIQLGWSIDHETAKEIYIQIECGVKPIQRGAPRDQEGEPPQIRIAKGSSTNWSGYAALYNLISPPSGSVSDVSGYWTVPALSPTETDAYSSVWVGIDGYSNGTVEQIGTEHDWVNSSQENYAWFEMYPQYAYEIEGFPVNIGDEMSAEVKYINSSQFRLSLYNHTHGVYTIVPSSYTRSSSARRSSAEWIVEAPSDNNGILPLADFNSVNWTNCQATIKGVTGSISNSHWHYDKINMVTNTNAIKALTSGLSNNGTQFSVNWEHE